MSEGRKYDSGKPSFLLLPPIALCETAHVLTFGAEKYDAENWRHVDDGQRRYLDAALRHINAFQRGESHDEESGLHTLAHAAASLLIALERCFDAEEEDDEASG